ncbi:MAG: hypothetical protein IH946_07030 [Bacteroidetes bacterium]|nr:hypothetical protein [Bacteroidota bacterium]
MQRTITQEDLVRFIYNETTQQETEQIKDSLKKDWKVKEQYEELMKVHDVLNRSILKPSQTSVDLILKHSKKTSPFVSMISTEDHD